MIVYYYFGVLVHLLVDLSSGDFCEELYLLFVPYLGICTTYLKVVPRLYARLHKHVRCLRAKLHYL